MFDVFLGPLTCPACGDSKAEEAVQTHLRGDASQMRVGFELDAVDLEPRNILGSGYLLVRLPGPGGPIRLLDTWICWACGTEQWALVEIAGCKVSRIDTVRLDRATLESANFIGEIDTELLARHLGGDMVSGEAAVDVLRQRLA